jgi:hypothetical protein
LVLESRSCPYGAISEAPPMVRFTSLVVALSTFVAAGLAPATASADPPATKTRKTARIVKARACAKPAVEIAAGAETATFALVDCTGNALPAGVDQLSILARPGTAPKPKEKVVVASRAKPGADVAPGIRRVDARLVERLELVVDHFRKEGQSPRVELVSGYRPKSTGSYHSTGRALDFKLEGVKNEDVVAFCKTLPDTGCGYYPNSSFVHVDAREHGAGHVSWIDISRPGEAPHYVTSWPPPGSDEPAAAPAPAPALSLPALPTGSEWREGHSDYPKTPPGVLPYF